ncbi:MAG: glycosyltransferase family 2 protein [Chlamydiota bacterium]|nr:glycosyltransferase family 2 protein [Chlamydiota bacterium]
MDEKNISVAIIIPVLNEESAIGKVIEQVPSSYRNGIIVVDNGSTDRTSSILETLDVKYVVEQRRGYGSACLKALSLVPKDTRIIVFMDGDNSEDPTYIKELLRPIIEGRADFVLGARVPELREKDALGLAQRFGNVLVTTMIRLFYGYTYQDMGPFRAIGYGPLQSFQMQDKNYGWNVEMQLKALKHRLRIMEVPVPYRKRIGKSKISGTFLGVLQAGTKMLYSVWKYGF